MDWDAGVISAWSALILGLLGALGAAIKWGDSRQQARAREQLQQLQQMAETLARADHQLHPNSGQSLADKIDRIEASQTRTEERVTRISDDLERERSARAQDDTAIRSELDRLGQSAVREHRSLWDTITGRQP